mmetsp:Transcript_16757/g.38545  ORF Transcript_16757/g.38545 Transcript_16757/m.38545 type:complete len:104 (+) Transcript_16757:1161-1472(+)
MRVEMVEASGEALDTCHPDTTTGSSAWMTAPMVAGALEVLADVLGATSVSIHDMRFPGHCSSNFQSTRFCHNQLQGWDSHANKEIQESCQLYLFHPTIIFSNL